jgi:hypothetical protein
VTCEDAREVKREIIHLPDANPLDKVARLVELGVNTLLCGGITERCASILHGTPISIIPWLQGDAEAVLARFLLGDIQEPSSPEGGTPCTSMTSPFTEQQIAEAMSESSSKGFSCM